MNFLLLAALILAQTADLARAADSAQVRAPRANVRAAPSVRSKILTKLDRGKVVDRIGQRGNWTKVRIGARIPAAWIYSPLLEPLPSPFARFQGEYARLNETARSAAGGALFERVRVQGTGVVYIETSAVWGSIAEEEQRSYIDSLYRSWKEANGGNPVILHIYDGKTHRLQSDLPP